MAHWSGSEREGGSHVDGSKASADNDQGYEEGTWGDC